MTFYAPKGGLPAQTDLTTDRAVFTEAYAVLPRRTMTDIVTSRLPFWDDTRLWVIARPLSGFAETFSQYIVEVAPGGGSDRPETDPAAEAVLFVVAGNIVLTVAGEKHTLTSGGYAYLPPGGDWAVRNTSDAAATFHLVRKAYERVDGIDVPPALVTNEADVEGGAMPDSPDRMIDLKKIDHGAIWEGTKGSIVADFRSRVLYPFKNGALDYYKPRKKEELLPPMGNFQKQWINAAKGSLKTACNFEYSGNLIETVLVGMVAYRAGRKIKYNPEKGEVVGDAEANALLSRKYREGWTLNG